MVTTESGYDQPAAVPAETSSPPPDSKPPALPQRFYLPRHLLTPVLIQTFDLPKGASEKEYVIDQDGPAIPLAIHNAVKALEEVEGWEQTPDLVVLRRNESLLAVDEESMVRRESDRFKGVIAITALDSTMKLHTWRHPPLEPDIERFTADGTTTFLDATAYHAVQSRSIVATGFHILMGRRQPDYEVKAPSNLEAQPQLLESEPQAPHDESVE